MVQTIPRFYILERLTVASQWKSGAPLPDLILLNAGRLGLAVNPAGGAIVAFRFDRGGHVDDLLRRAAREDVERNDPLGASAFPLVPFFGFLRSGTIPIAGGERPMAPNHPSEPFALHGDGWLAEWGVESAGDTGATLAYAHDGDGGYPFPYRAALGFALSDEALTVTVSVNNAGQGPMPAGIGLHPYFHKTADVELRARMSGVWPEPPDTERLGAQALPPDWDFTGGRRLDELELDHCFNGWDGHATVTWPSRRLALDISATPPLGILCVWSPKGEPFFCAEPVSQVNDGFFEMARGAPDHGMRVLEAGSTLSGTVHFRPREL